VLFVNAIKVCGPQAVNHAIIFCVS